VNGTSGGGDLALTVAGKEGGLVRHRDPGGIAYSAVLSAATEMWQLPHSSVVNITPRFVITQRGSRTEPSASPGTSANVAGSRAIAGAHLFLPRVD
jgi:hypothetical protein